MGIHSQQKLGEFFAIFQPHQIVVISMDFGRDLFPGSELMLNTGWIIESLGESMFRKHQSGKSDGSVVCMILHASLALCTIFLTLWTRWTSICLAHTSRYYHPKLTICRLGMNLKTNMFFRITTYSLYSLFDFLFKSTLHCLKTDEYHPFCGAKGRYVLLFLLIVLGQGNPFSPPGLVFARRCNTIGSPNRCNMPRAFGGKFWVTSNQKVSKIGWILGSPK